MYTLILTQTFRVTGTSLKASPLSLHADTAAAACVGVPFPLPCTFPPVSLGWVAGPSDSLWGKEAVCFWSSGRAGKAFHCSPKGDCFKLWSGACWKLPPIDASAYMDRGLNAAKYSDNRVALSASGCRNWCAVTVPARRQTGLSRAFDLLKAWKSIGRWNYSFFIEPPKIKWPVTPWKYVWPCGTREGPNELDHSRTQKWAQMQIWR